MFLYIQYLIILSALLIAHLKVTKKQSPAHAKTYTVQYIYMESLLMYTYFQKPLSNARVLLT